MARQARHGFGPGGMGPRGMGPGGPMGPTGTMDWVFGPDGPIAMAGQMGQAPWGPGGRRRGRRERGDVRAAILLLLAEKPRHGYEIITEIGDRSEGAWQPSPGSIYPVLKRLAREGLLESSEDEGRRVFALTAAGQDLVAAERDGWGEPWKQAAAAEQHDEEQNVERAAMMREAQQLAAAVWQVAQLNNAEDLQAASDALAEARKAIYRRLAE